MRITFFILLIFSSLFFFQVNPLIAKGSKKKVKPVINKLEINDFILLATKNDRRFQEILIDNLALKYKKDIEMPVGDLVVDLTSKYNFALNGENQNAAENRVTLSKLFPEAGSEVSLSYGSTPTSTGESSTSTFSAMVSQPIARNAFGRATRLKSKIIDFDISITRFQIIEAYEDYLASLLGVYYQWYYNYSNMVTADLAYRDSKRLLANIIRRRRNSIAKQVDVDKVNLQVVEKRENYLRLKYQFENSSVLIREAIGKAYEKSMIPVFSSYGGENLKLSFNRSEKIKGRTGEIFSLLESRGKAEVDYAYDDLLPSVNLLFGVDKTGTGQWMKNSNENIFAGVNFSYSIGQQKESAEYELSRIDLKRTKLNIYNLKNKLYSDLENIYKEILLEKELVNGSTKKINLGKRVVRLEIDNYRKARTTLSETIDVINNLEQYRFEKIAHQVRLNTLIVEWLRLRDILVKKNILDSQ